MHRTSLVIAQLSVKVTENIQTVVVPVGSYRLLSLSFYPMFVGSYRNLVH